MNGHARRALGLSAATIAVTALTAACTSTAAESDPDDSAAVLEVAQQQIHLPLDEFVLSNSELRMVEHANSLRVQDCVSESGFEYPEATRDWKNEPPVHDRLFGPWELAWVSQHGYDYPPSDETLRIEELNDMQPDGFNEAVRRCVQSVELLPALSVNDGLSLASVGYMQSYSDAQSSPSWAEATDEWKTCLRAAGYVIGDDPDAWIPEFGADAEAEIRAAIADVKCKQEVDLVQRLGNIVASEQAEFISENKAALETLRNESQSIASTARSEIGVE